MWEWREDKINLIGSTQAITMRMRHKKILPALTLGTDPIQLRSATDALGFATGAPGGALPVDLLGTAQTVIEELINRHSPGADQRPAEKALWLPPAHDLFVNDRSIGDDGVCLRRHIRRRAAGKTENTRD